MADHPETTALRLAEAATEGPWDFSASLSPGPNGAWTSTPFVHRRNQEDQALAVVAPSYERRHDRALRDAAHIAHAHPGRVRAWLGCVARLRERAAEGHSSECVKRYRPAMDCKCGHEDDLAALAAVDAEG